MGTDYKLPLAVDLVPAPPKAQSGFSAANRSPQRGRIYFPAVRQADEVRSHDRQEIARQARFLTGNSGYAERAAEAMSLHVVGPGFRIKPLTADKDWNKRVSDAFNAHASSAQSFDKSGNLSFYEAQKLFERQNYITGEMFALLTESDTPRRTAMMALYEYSQVGTPWRARNQEQWPEGIRSNRFNRAVAYRFLTDKKGGFKDYGAENVIHYFDYVRPGQRRGLSKYVHACNNYVDIIENRAYLKHGNKTANLIGYYLKQAAASGAAGLEGMASVIPGANDEKPPLESIDRQKVFLDGLPGGSPGGQVTALPLGQEIATIEHARPSTNEMQFEFELLRDIALGHGVHPELLFYITKLSNQPTRLALKDLEKLLEYRQPRIARIFCTRYFIYWLSKEINSGRISLPRRDFEWWLHGWICPRKITVDVGRDGSLELKQVESGLVSPGEFFGSRGGDFETEALNSVTQQATWLGYIFDACEDDERLRPEMFNFPGRSNLSESMDPAAVLAAMQNANEDA